jgi:hypothetical protein
MVDEYMHGEKIRPSMLKYYLKKDGDMFNYLLKVNDLSEVAGIDRVLSDVIDDREGMEIDGVMTFENFKILESEEFKISNIRQCLYKGINNAGIDAEKVIADYYDTNLGSGSVEIDSPEAHVFSVSGWHNSTIRVIVYNNDELDVFNSNLIEYLYNEICSKEIELVLGIKLVLSDFIKMDNFKDKFTEKMNLDNDKEFSIKVIEKITGTEFKINKNNHYIFEEKLA